MIPIVIVDVASVEMDKTVEIVEVRIVGNKQMTTRLKSAIVTNGMGQNPSVDVKVISRVAVRKSK